MMKHARSVFNSTCSVLGCAVGLLFLGLCVSRQASADPVDETGARTVVESWLRVSGARLGCDVGTKITGVRAYGPQESPTYYVVSLAPTGIVIVSADDWIEPVVGFVAGNEFDPSPLNPLGALVSGDMAGRMADVRSMRKRMALAGGDDGIPTRFAGNRSKWDALRDIAAGGIPKLPSIDDSRVPALLDTEWSQGKVGTNYCYNYYTPLNYVCGCGATAMAQVMRYHQYPTNGVGTNSFTIKIDGVSTNRPLMGREGNGNPYYWSDMPYSPSESTSDTERKAIGALCHDAGVAVGSSYTEDGTSSGPDDVAEQFTNTFYYGNAVFGFNGNGNIGSGLNNMVNPNLDAGHPVILAIAYSNNGHAVVCDGYGYNSGTMYHHVNMGWAGAYDAWYDLPDIYTYTSVYGCVYNVFKGGSGEIVSGRVVDQSGSAVSGVTVRAESSGGSYVTSVVSNIRGIYALPNLPGATSFTITASNEYYSFQTATVSTGVSTNYARASGNQWGLDFTVGTTNPPQPPTQVSATDGEYESKIRVTWSTSVGAQGYQVWRSASTSSSDAAVLTGTNLTSLLCDDTTGEEGVLYYYWVIATNTYGSSGFGVSDYGWRTLSAPTGVTATDGDYSNRVAVSWSAVGNATSYEVWRATSSTSGEASNLASAASTSYDDTSVSAGVTYYYWIKAVNTNSTSNLSDYDSGYTSSSDSRAVVYRLYSYGSADSTYEHLWTTSATERDVLDSYPSWTYEGVAWYAFTNLVTDSTPLYRLYASSVRQHHYTISAVEYVDLSDNNPAWTGEGIQYYVFAEQETGTMPVYRFYHSGMYLHHFTIDGNEATQINNHPEWGYVYEGIGFYAYTSSSLADETTRPGCDVAGSDILSACSETMSRARPASATRSAGQVADRRALAGAVRVPGDYDGDGLEDIAFYSPGGTWTVTSAVGGTIADTVAFGGDAWIPVAGDYNGDGRSDLVVYDGESGVWMFGDSEGHEIMPSRSWGGPGYVAVAGDYDGDSISDLAVYSARFGTWSIVSVSGNVMLLNFSWGGPGFEPLSVDCDGDGVDELALREVSTGCLFVNTLESCRTAR